jgi:hypothetical protein
MKTDSTFHTNMGGSEVGFAAVANDAAKYTSYMLAPYTFSSKGILDSVHTANASIIGLHNDCVMKIPGLFESALGVTSSDCGISTIEKDTAKSVSSMLTTSAFSSKGALNSLLSFNASAISLKNDYASKISGLFGNYASAADSTLSFAAIANDAAKYASSMLAPYTFASKGTLNSLLTANASTVGLYNECMAKVTGHFGSFTDTASSNLGFSAIANDAAKHASFVSEAGLFLSKGMHSSLLDLTTVITSPAKHELSIGFLTSGSSYEQLLAPIEPLAIANHSFIRPRSLTFVPARSSSKVVDRLYFGQCVYGDRKVSKNDWKKLLAEVVTPRFPAGLTVLSAEGQWQGASGSILKEPSYILELIYDDDPESDRAVLEIKSQYKSQFCKSR